MPKDYELSEEQESALQELFRRKRLEAGFERQSDAAADIGVSQDLISRLERSFTLNMRIGDLGLIMRRYGITPNDVYELMGVFKPQIEDRERIDYVRREILPVLNKLSPRSLELLRRIAESFIVNEHRKYAKVGAHTLQPGDIILWEGIERRVVGVRAAEDTEVQVALYPRTPGEPELLTLDQSTEVDQLQK